MVEEGQQVWAAEVLPCCVVFEAKGTVRVVSEMNEPGFNWFEDSLCDL